jgi:hypothetical protein
LTRYRSSLAADRARLVNRLQKTLEDTNIKLASVATAITGQSARALLEALLAGEHDPERLADLAQKRMKGKPEQLIQALQGTLAEPHRFLLASQLRQVDCFDQQIGQIEQELAGRLGLQSDPSEPEPAEPIGPLPAKEETTRPPETAEGSPPAWVQSDSSQPVRSAQAIHLLDEVLAMNVRVGAMVVAELGLSMDRFPDEAHLASWVGMTPAATMSANKRLSTKTGKGKRWLRQALIEVAHAAARRKDTFLGASSQRRRQRMGHKKAIVALAHRLLLIIYHLLKDRQPYRELGPGYLDEKAAEAAKRRALRTLGQLGYDVTLQETEVA